MMQLEIQKKRPSYLDEILLNERRMVMCSEHLVDSIFKIDAITEFCKNSLQQLPVNVQFLSTAVQQIKTYLGTLSLQGMSHNYIHSLTTSMKSLESIASVATISFEDLVVAYETLRVVILLLLIHYHIFIVANESPLLSKFKTCLLCVDKGNLSLGLNLSEVIMPQIEA